MIQVYKAPDLEWLKLDKLTFDREKEAKAAAQARREELPKVESAYAPSGVAPVSGARLTVVDVPRAI